MCMLAFSVLIIGRLDSQSKFQMSILFQHGVFILGSVNFCATFRGLGKRTGVKLGEVSYLFIFYNITIS